MRSSREGSFAGSLVFQALRSACSRPFVIGWVLLLGLAATLKGAERIVVNEIHFDPKDKKPLQFVEIYNPGQSVNIAGWSLNGFIFTNGTLVASNSYLVVAASPGAFEKEFGFRPLGPLPEKLGRRHGKVVLRDAARRVVDEVNYQTGFPWPTAVADAGPSLERVHHLLSGSEPGAWRSSGCLPTTNRLERPSPGRRNSVAVTNAPVLFRAVGHAPHQPKSGERVLVTAQVHPAASVRSAALEYQVVAPGRYIRKTDPDYQTNWQTLVLRDDGREGDAKAGDGVFSVIMAAELQQHRRLVRYVVKVTDKNGAVLQVPYLDDDSPNFAWFVYDGLPAWSGAAQPGKTPAQTFSSLFMGTLPAYHLIARADDVERSQWDGSFNKKRCFGTLIYDGRVYDHIQFRNRGKASTYVSGKNKWSFKFNRGHELLARDLWGRPYVRSWDSFSMNPGASPWAQVNRGMAGMDEAVAFRAYQLAGVPSPATHWVQFRVIDAVEEAPPNNQYAGDLWGLYDVVQDIDGSWIQERGLPDGNVYYPESGLKHLGEGMPSDGSDWNRFTAGPRGPLESWWRTNMNLRAYYSFHALNRVLSNVDLRPGANHYFFHPPDGRWTPVPWDLDMMFLPKVHQPGFIDQARCLDIPVLRREYQNRAREILDLFCSDVSTNGGQVGQLVDELAGILCPQGQERSWPELDQAMWNWHPRSQAKGAFYMNPCRDDRFGGHWTRRLETPDFAGFCRYIVEFCTDSRPARNYQPNDGDQRGYGFGHLWWESRDADIPRTPKIEYVGPAGFPPKKLAFRVSPFASPVTNGCVAVQWRVGRIAAPGLVGFRPGASRQYELEDYWTSGELPVAMDWKTPSGVCGVGGTFRVRARHLDESGRWSHWSSPVQFACDSKR